MSAKYKSLGYEEGIKRFCIQGAYGIKKNG